MQKHRVSFSLAARVAAVILLGLLSQAFSCEGNYSPKTERWVLGGKLYVFDYHSSDQEKTQYLTIHPVNPDGSIGDALEPDKAEQIRDASNRTRGYDVPATLFRDSVFSAPRFRRMQAGGSSRIPPVNHMLDFVGAWIYRFDSTQQAVTARLQLTCTDTLENAYGFDVSRDNTVEAVAIQGNNTKTSCVVIVDPQTYTVINKVPLPQGQNAKAVAITPDAAFAYVTSSVRGDANSTVYVIDLKNANIAASIAVDEPNLDSIAMTPDGSQAYVASSGATGFTLPVIDTATNTFSRLSVNVPTPLSPVWMVVHPTGAKLYIVSYRFGPAGPMTVIDTASGAVLSRTNGYSDYDPSIVGLRSDPQFTPDGRYLFVMGGSTQITMYDTIDDSVKANIAVPKQDNSFGDRRVGFFFIPD